MTLLFILLLLSALAFLAAILLALNGGWERRPVSGLLACAWYGHEAPTRHPLGGFECPRCGGQEGDLGKLGLMDEGYVERGKEEQV